MEIAEKVIVVKKTVEIGDIVEWEDDGSKIVGVVCEITSDNILRSVALTDTRGFKCPHLVNLYDDGNLKLIMKGTKIFDDFDKLNLADE